MYKIALQSISNSFNLTSHQLPTTISYFVCCNCNLLPTRKRCGRERAPATTIPSAQPLVIIISWMRCSIQSIIIHPSQIQMCTIILSGYSGAGAAVSRDDAGSAFGSWKLPIFVTQQDILMKKPAPRRIWLSWFSQTIASLVFLLVDVTRQAFHP